MADGQLTTPTRQSVEQALNDAAENGYRFEGWTPRAIAIDLCAFDWTHERCEIEAVEKIVAEIRGKE
ncbi:hypothetical protein [Methylocystis parvus]|uniref:hypothetical protein n=1 Tax=Methylocystis parvus TaxID=134 RepID=UPI003C744D11